MIEVVAHALLAADPEGARFARALRRTYDQIYEGHNTDRCSWEQLLKTEKTHFGSLLQINLQREFWSEFDDGLVLDYQIAGYEVACTWAKTDGAHDGIWKLPPEAVGQLCLIVTSCDEQALWSAGLVRRAKPQLEETDSIRWIWRHAPIPETVRHRMDPGDLEAMRVDIDRSREDLRPEGIVVFGDAPSHRAYAEALGLPPLGDGDSMSARLIRVAGSGVGVADIGGAWYRLCSANEAPTRPAPPLPKSRERA